MAFLTSEGAEYLFKKLSDAKNIKITGNSNGSRVSDVVNSIVNKADNITKAISKEVVNTSKMFKVGTGSVDVNSDVEDGFSEIGIKGVTYQNFCDLSKLYTNLSFFTIKDGSIEFLNILDGARTTFNNMGLLKPNTKYTVVVNCERMCNSNDQNMPIRMNDDNSPYGINIFGLNITRVGLSRHLFTTPSDVTNLKLLFYNNTRNTGFRFKYILILEGDQTNNPNIPSYFEGIKGVGEKSRNLFNPNTVKFTTYIDHNTSVESANSFYVVSDFIEVASDMDYIVKGLPVVYFYNANKEKIDIKNSATEGIVRTPANCKWVRIRNWHHVLIDEQKLLIKKTLFTLWSCGTFQQYYDGYGVECVSCGKNLVDLKSMSLGTINNSGEVLLNSNGVYKLTEDFIKVNPKNKIYLYYEYDKNDTSTPIYNMVAYYDKDFNYLAARFDIAQKGVLISPHVNTCYIRLRIRKETIKLSLTEHEPDYEPYIEDKIRFLIDKPLMRLPDGVCDEITKDGRLIKRIGKIVFDGDERIFKSSYGTNRFAIRVDDSLLGYTTNLICDKFKPGDTTKADMSIANHSIDNDINRAMYFSISSCESVNDFKTWLSNNPTTVYYELGTPVITQLNVNQLRVFKDGYIKTNTFITPETTHVVQLNKSAQIEKTVKEVQSLDNKVSKLEGLYDELLLSTSQSLDLLCLDFDLREEDE